MKKGSKLIAKEYSWNDGTKLFIRKDNSGNTYIGDIAHKLMHIFNRNKINTYDKITSIMENDVIPQVKGGCCVVLVYE